MSNTCLFIIAVLISINAVYAQSSGDSSGSGSGSGSGDQLTCANMGCSHYCNDTYYPPVCYCPIGYMLNEVDERTCQECQGGYWGLNCNRTCECMREGLSLAAGNPCNNTNGMCECNSCWRGDQCEIGNGTRCLYEFFQEINKSESVLRQRYGGASFPAPDLDEPDILESFIANNLLEVDSFAYVANPELTRVPRTDAGDLAKLTFGVPYNVGGRDGAETALNRLQEKVKLGDLRVTLIQQLFSDRAEVTINAGTQN